MVFLIQEGPRYKVDTVVFQGNTVFEPHQFRAVMLLQPGDYYTAKAMQHDEESIRQELYGRDGYPYARVQITHAFGNREGTVNVTVFVLEGERITIGKIEIVGNQVTKDNVIRRVLLIQPTEPYNALAAEESRRQLMNTALFTKVDIQPKAAGRDHERDVLVLVEEGRTTSFMIGAGISSDAGLLGTVRIENRNFDLGNWPRTWGQLFSPNAFKGAGQTLAIVAEPGTEINRFQVQFYEPFLLDKPIGLGSNLFVFTRPREAYDETRVGYIVSVNKRVRRNWAIEGAFRIEGVSISGVDSTAPSDIMNDEGSHALISGKFTLARDTTDNRFLPTEGERLSLSAEPAGGTDAFVKLLADYRVYRTVRTDIYNRRSTVNARVAVGWIGGQAPIYERFYGGGLSTLRGFEFRGVGPHQGVNDDPIGGHFQVLAGAEYAFPLWGKSLGVLFVDTGTVEETASVTSYRASVGFEVRIPIDFFGSIPMTIGIGVPIAKDAKDQTQLLHFLFGTSF